MTGMFKRFRDAATGMFTSKADADRRPGRTVGETHEPALSLGDVAFLSAALQKSRNTSYPAGYAILSVAIQQVLQRRGAL